MLCRGHVGIIFPYSLLRTSKLPFHIEPSATFGTSGIPTLNLERFSRAIVTHWVVPASLRKGLVSKGSMFDSQMSGSGSCVLDGHGSLLGCT